MTEIIYLRMAGYVTAILLHVGNMVAINTIPRSKEVMEDIRVVRFSQMQYRYLTSWTFVIQIAYSVIGLFCDYLTLKNAKTRDYKLPKYLKGVRDTLFASVLWPSCVVVFSLFWVIFSYDRSLVFPEFLDQILSPINNHIMHTAILPLALLEILYLPRTKPKSHLRYLAHLTFHFVLYAAVMVYTYMEKGLWLYPILKNLYGTIYFPLLFISVYILALLSYYLQWILPTFAKEEKSRRKYTN